MASKIQLEISGPCSANWGKMNRTEKGRFCQSCQKEVIDFTGMSEQQLALFFKSNKKAVCGKLRNDQLRQELTVPRKRIHWFRYLLQVALPALIFSNKGSAQGAVASRVKVEAVRKDQESLRIKVPEIDVAPIVREIKGHVVDGQKQPVSGASVMKKGTSEGTVTNALGEFTLKVNDEDPIVYLEVSSVGYAGRTIGVKRDEPAIVELVLNEVWMGEVVVTIGTVSVKEKKTKPVKTEPVKLIQTNMDTLYTFFKVYPNPVMTGSSLNIELTGRLKEGYYTLAISAMDGRSVFQKNELWIDAEARVMNISIPPLLAGSYALGLRNKKDGKVYSQMIVIKAE